MINLSLTLPESELLLGALQSVASKLINDISHQQVVYLEGLNTNQTSIAPNEDLGVEPPKLSKSVKVRAPYGYKADGTPKRRPGRPKVNK
jgi:hypothetical protein